MLDNSLIKPLCVLLFVKCCMAANILIISPIPSVSHSMWNQKLAKLLADRFHHVTVLDVGSSRNEHNNITHIEMKVPLEFQELDLNYYSQQKSPIKTIDTMSQWMHKSCQELLDLQKTKLFLEKYKNKKKPFDLIILDIVCCESFLGFVEIFGSQPIILASAYGKSITYMEFAGNYDNPAYVPYAGSPFISNMNFMERVENTIIYFYYKYVNQRQISGQNEMARQFFGSNIQDVRDIARKAVITLLNYHPALDGVKPFLPSTIAIGGFHIDPPKPLDKELQTFLDNAKNGAIYFSFGSNLKCESISEEKFNIFLQVFKEIKMNVIWKCEKQVNNLPANVRFGKWFNQSDILAHSNVKIFISHGGLLGAQEAVYNAVPMLVIPFIVDQHFNAQILEKLGLAVRLTYAELTVNILRNSLNKLLTDKSYQARMKERSAAFRDNPIPPKDLAIYWIEYVLRHPRTDLFRSATQYMPIYKILLLDVIGFFIIIITGILLFFITLMKIVLKICKNFKDKEKIN